MPRKGMAKPRQEEWGQVKARKEQDCIKTVASRTVAKVGADLEQTKRMIRKTHDKLKVYKLKPMMNVLPGTLPLN